MANWNSVPLEVIYEILGWLAFVSWTIGSYPQVILNFRRKSYNLIFVILAWMLSWGVILLDGSRGYSSAVRRRMLKQLHLLRLQWWQRRGVVGLSFDFVLLNLTKHSSYLIYNASLYFSPTIQNQYFQKYGYAEMIPVAANDVAFSIHAVLLTTITLFQIAIYDRGTQKVSKVSIGVVSDVWLTAAVCFFIALPNHSWLWLITIFNSIQVFMTSIKYIPQAIMNFLRKSTDGFSIGNILLDFSGGIANYLQMVVQSVDQDSWVNFYGNIGKVLISLVSVFFDIIFICQHYVLYPGKKSSESVASPKQDDQIREQLVRPSDQSPPENV